MFYIALCDDEWQAVEILTGYLSEIKRSGLQLESVPFLNGRELVHQYERGRKFDIIILDMLMKPLNGIETARLIRKYDSEVPILIVTGTVEYAMDGYQVNAYRYILKPVDKAYFLQEVRTILTSIARLQNKYFSFTNEKGLFKIKTTDIYYFESNMRTLSVCHLGGKTTFTGKISEVEESLSEQSFFRIHKSYVVNLKHIRNIFKDTVTLEDIEELRIGDYLGVKPCLIQGLSHQHPALKSSVRPDKPEERSKLISALNVLFIEDPSLSFSINSYSDELEISLYGLTQKEIIQTLLEERFSVKAHFDEIKTIYKERPKKKVNKIIHIEVPPNPYWASIGLTLEPLPIGSGLQIESEISFGYLNHSFQNAVFEGIRMSCQSGLHGWEVTDLKVTFTYALYYSPISTPADFRQLSPYVFRLALQQSGVDILEPMLYFELQIPQVASSKAITDLQKMMSEIKGISCNNEWCLIEGKVPLNTSKDYASEVSSYTKGLGTFMVKPCGYQITKGGYSDNTRMEEKDKLLFMFEKSVSSK